MHINHKYNTQIPKKCDVLIIGGGIGGLTCANYLAKIGVKVVLVEKHYVPGGYCSSFIKGRYYFDAGVHSLGGCRDGGEVNKLIIDLELGRKIDFIRINPSDVVISKNHEIYFYNDLRKTITELQKHFPGEANEVSNFINYIVTTDTMRLYLDLKAITFAEFLDRFFKDWELKSILSTMLGNFCLPSNKASALTAVILYREFIFDGGYYPKGGIQKFPDALLEKFQENGGIVLLLSQADEIILDHTGKVKAVKVKYLGRQLIEIQTKIVVANCDPFQIFEKLLRKTERFSHWFKLVDTKAYTASAFMVHLGVNHDISHVVKYRCNIWSYLKNWHIDNYYNGVLRGELERGEDSFLFCSIPSLHDVELLPKGFHSIQTIIMAPHKIRDTWDACRAELAEDIIQRLEQYIPGINQWIEVKKIATPSTLFKYTGNYKGAMYGWASTCGQIGLHNVDEETDVKGLYMVGHWAGRPVGYSGVSTVIASGRNVARVIKRKLSKKSILMSEAV